MMAAGQLSPTHLRCEYRSDPRGIGVAKPRLSWIVTSAERGAEQSAYQILVSGAPDSLAQDRGDLWDSGKVESDDTAQIAYSGTPLTSSMQCYWKVRVWDGKDQPSGWSETAAWSMGLLNAEDWKAQWIGLDEVADKGAGGSLDGAKWLWFAGDPGDPSAEAPQGIRCFRKAFDLPARMALQKAVCVVTVDDQFTLYINGRQAARSDGKTDAWKRLREVAVGKFLQPGRNVLAVRAVNSQPSPAGFILKLTIPGGQRLVIASDASWRCTDAPGQGWTTPDADDTQWPAARVLGDYGRQPWGKAAAGGPMLQAPRMLRREFSVRGPMRRAVIYASALGIYELHLNGQRVGNDYFAPGWTDYNKRVYYNTYDVTRLLTKGGNVIGGLVADGWYAGYVGYGHRREHYGSKTRLLAQLDIEYEDGSHEVVATDPSWRGAVGSLSEADFLMGETCDARLAREGWDRAGYDASDWSPVAVTPKVGARLQAYPGVTVQVFQEIRPQAISQPRPGTYVFNMGTNFAGVARLRVTAPRGTRLQLRYAERLNPDGTIYTTNLRGARATDTYICRGQGEEVFQPHFTFHGFQYVELTGYPGTPDADTVTGIELTSATPPAGTFECSDAISNQLYHNICQTQRANFIDIPTDCPQRDERLGWTGDAQAYIGTACCNNDVAAFFTKWLVDLADAQRADGQFPCVAPLKVAGGDGGPAWADAGAICPWTIYRVYGDRRLLEDYYPRMAKFIEFCRNRSNNLLPPKKYHCFGDWLSIRANTPKDIIYTAYFAYSTRLTAQAAAALGRTADAEKYEALFEAIRDAFNKAYVSDDGRVKGDTQTAYVLALAFDLVSGERRTRAIERLIANIESRQWHLSTGFVGTRDLMRTLSRVGRTDVAYRLFHNTTFPSWGFCIKHGATSIWERWDGWTPEKGFQNPGMNSFAHYAYGAVGQWMFETIGGIRAAEVGYREIEIRPQPGGKLTWAKTSYDSIRGRIATHWRRRDGVLELQVTVPANTVARVYVPAARPEDVTEGGTPAAKSPGVKLSGTTEDCAVFTVGGGSYSFVARAGK